MVVKINTALNIFSVRKISQRFLNQWICFILYGRHRPNRIIFSQVSY